MIPVTICFSGKRKCGKDFMASLLADRLEGMGCKVVICGVSYPLKEEYAQLNGVDVERLKYDIQYKEVYRQDMIEWSDRIRNKDSGYFCRKVLASAESADVLIVTDCRRLSDVQFFKIHCGSRLRLLRIESTLPIREMRGFQFVKGIDDQTTECGLDEYTDWDIVITNDIQIMNGILSPKLDECLTRLCSEIRQLLLNEK